MKGHNSLTILGLKGGSNPRLFNFSQSMVAKKAWLTTASSPPSEDTQPRRRAGFLVSSCGYQTKTRFFFFSPPRCLWVTSQRRSRAEWSNLKFVNNDRTMGSLSRAATFPQVVFGRCKVVKREVFFGTAPFLRWLPVSLSFSLPRQFEDTARPPTHPDCVWRLPVEGSKVSSDLPLSRYCARQRNNGKVPLNLWLQSFFCHKQSGFFSGAEFFPPPTLSGCRSH